MTAPCSGAGTWRQLRNIRVSFDIYDIYVLRHMGGMIVSPYMALSGSNCRHAAVAVAAPAEEWQDCRARGLS